MTATNELIEIARKSLEGDDFERLGNALAAIAINEPSRWRQLLMLSGIVPEPKPRRSDKDRRLFHDRLACLMGAMSHLLCDDTEHLEMVSAMLQIAQAAAALQVYYNEILKKLNDLACTKLPPCVQLWRLVALLEDQHYLSVKELSKCVDNQRYRDPHLFWASSLTNPKDGSHISFGENFDGLCEVLELAIRFILHGGGPLSLPQLAETNSPYDDPEFQAFIELADTWRIIGNVWANIKFRKWEWVINSKKQNTCKPIDHTEMLREHVAAIRYNTFVEHRLLRAISVKRDARYKDYLKKVIDSLNLSAETPIWNGELDLKSLKDLCDISDFKLFCNEYVNSRHYASLLGDLRVAHIDWNIWCTGNTVLRSLAKAVMIKLSEMVDENDGAAPLKRVLIVSSKILKHLIVASSNLDEEKAELFIKALGFDPTRKNLEIWDQPLIPCSSDSYFFVPSLICNGNPARAVENFVDEWGGATFGSRGIPFEKYLVNELRNRTDGVVSHGVKVPFENHELEFDILFFWKGFLFLIEAKCCKSVFSAADYCRAKEQIDKSIDQLLIRKREIGTIWALLRERTPSLNLPNHCPNPEVIKCISITNVMDFTGYQRDGIVVTDDSCFFRFFEGPEIAVVSVGQSGEEIVAFAGRIRENDEPTPQELLTYLADPPQMKDLLRFASCHTMIVSPVSDQTRAFAFAYAEYNPPEVSLV